MAGQSDGDELRAAEAVFREFLGQQGLKYTPERRAVLRAVMRNEQHFEAEQLLFELRTGGQRVAKATIYRTLPLLAQCGIIKQVRFGEKQSHYEHTFGHPPHDHLVCRRCRRIVEFDGTLVASMALEMASRHQFAYQTHRFQILGLCPECAEASSDSRESPTAAPRKPSTGPRTSGSSRR